MNANTVLAIHGSSGFYIDVEDQNGTAPNSLPALALEILLGLGFRYARIALAPLNHIALASEPANILDACSLYRLGQRRRQATVR